MRIIDYFFAFSCGLMWGMFIERTVKLFKLSKEATKSKMEFSEYIKNIKDEGDKLLQESMAEASKKPKRKPEVHTFQWRYDGKMNEVEIIIDPNINAHIPGTQEEFEELLKSGNIDRMEDFYKGFSKDEESLKTVNKFIFSRDSVEQMRIAGHSPDEVVARMLKAAGRMD